MPSEFKINRWHLNCLAINAGVECVTETMSPTATFKASLVDLNDTDKPSRDRFSAISAMSWAAYILVVVGKSIFLLNSMPPSCAKYPDSSVLPATGYSIWFICQLALGSGKVAIIRLNLVFLDSERIEIPPIICDSLNAKDGFPSSSITRLYCPC